MKKGRGLLQRIVSRNKNRLKGVYARLARKAVCLGCAVVLGVGLVPAPAFASMLPLSIEDAQPNYDWYASGASSFTLESVEDLKGFANLVNGVADADADGTADPAVDFSGKVVQLAEGASFNLMNGTMEPIGSQDHPFDGTFDGNGCIIDNVVIQGSSARAADLGLFGHAGPNSLLRNVTLGSSCELKVELGSESDRSQDNTVEIHDVGMLVGSSEGSLANITTEADVSVVHHADQTPTLVFPVRNVGGIAGSVLGDVSNCEATANASLTVCETGCPYKPVSTSEDWDDQAVLVLCVGGLVGQAGEIDSSKSQILCDAAKRAGQSFDGYDGTREALHGAISECANASRIEVDTPQTNGTDRFGNTIYSQSADVGGIAGYSRGSIYGCVNEGFINGPHATGVGGIVGNVRCQTETTGYNGNFTSTGFDDGVLAKRLDSDKEGERSGEIYSWSAENSALEIKDCVNMGTLYAYAFPAGIVGRAGTYVDIAGCVNGSATKEVQIIATRSTKPFGSGIAGSVKGVVSYCANYASVYSGSWKNGEGSDVSLGGGYYTSGLVGNTIYYTKANEDGDQVRYTPLPEVVACFNGGAVKAIDNMRQRLLVGDNAGYVHNCVGLQGLCYKDYLVYGMYEGDTESSGGTWDNLYAVSDDCVLDGSVIEDADLSVLGVLNAQAGKGDYAYYWVASASKNDGYPVLNTQLDDSFVRSDIQNAQVELEANASYNGTAAVPRAKVTLDGRILTQNVDFKVVPDSSDAVELSEEPVYTATICGLGAYTGTADAKLAYGISKGDLSSCNVTVVSRIFNWESQMPAASEVQVKDAAGNPVDSSEYTYALDPQNKALIDGKAVNVGRYILVLKAAEGPGTHFTGTADGVFSIRTAKIGVDKDADKQAQLAKPEGVRYLGKTYEWDSKTLAVDQKDYQPKMVVAYTGRSIKPVITDITFKGRSLEYGVDYKTLYGNDSIMDGTTDDTPNVGKKGGTETGYVTARYVSGGNFSNYDVMMFTISDEPGVHQDSFDISLADVEGTEDVIYEPGDPYKPVTVWYGGSQLEEGVDYSISYKNNNAPGTASFTITGKGSFQGTKTGTFNIVKGNPYELAYDYDETAGTATVTGVSYQGVRDSFALTIPSTVSKDGKTYTVTEIAKMAFGGASSADFLGSKTNLSKEKVGSVTIPATVTAIGDYAFSAVSATSWSKLASVTFASVSSSQLKSIGKYAFRGCGNLTAFTFPAKLESIGDGAFNSGTVAGTLVESKLKRLVFLSKSASLPSISTRQTFQGLGSKGSKVQVLAYKYATGVKDMVLANAAKTKGSHAGMNFSYVSVGTGSMAYCKYPTLSSKTYTGKSQTPSVKVTYGSYTLINGTDYTVSYSSNKYVGTAKVKVTGKGIFTSSKTLYFKINPKGTSISKLSKGKKAFTVYWKKQSSQTSAYQIRYSLYKSMAKAKTITTTKTYKKVTKLKSKKTYYVQVRTYKTVGGKRYYSSWSSRKYVKTA